MSQDILLAVTALFGLTIVTAAALRGWQGWLALKVRELETRHAAPMRAEPREIETRGDGTGRIEIADLRERIRKLEAIASGVDL
ncbi:hypothetical protein GRI97_04670 [Altererythrobacter xixiisoli]|uniref:Uncharacterized protein n=1 Tax=Croceibacterium xixiisoli TaxID=1476466 RepID=A0A6I4TTT3_9SPHN|nr:hypothetical protein [Croceibacterium xixiisoli]MXO98277.1 hypothetical protein [Croceibacterium xixiisoli]